MNKLMRYFLVVCLVLSAGCVGIPDGISPVENFDKSRYLGKWYEIARLDHSFERGLEGINAEYTVRDGGGINVVNSGFDTKKNERDKAVGKAFFVGEETTGHLKVSFFGPFYGSYVIFDLGEDYDYAFVTSTDRSYLWFLSRSRVVDAELKKYFIKTISDLGFDQSKLIFVDHSEKFYN